MVKNKINKASFVAVVLWMALIFYLSHQPSSTSSSLSGGMVDLFIKGIESLLPFMKIDWVGFHFLVRKGAHLTAYFILGILVLHTIIGLKMGKWRAILLTFFICVMYAITDEVHQLFILGRSGEVTDVLVDSVGAAGGIGLYVLIRNIKNKR